MPAGFASPVSRRVSEIVGVALFALSLIWLIALASYDPNDTAWFFATGSNDVPANFIGRVGAFLAELSFQVVGFGSYLLPALVAAGGWQYFWCRPVDALYTKATGVTLLLACSSAMLSLLVGSATFGARTFEAGGFLGAVLAAWFTAYLNRTGSIIVIVTLMALALILATQVSLGRVFAVGVEQAAVAAERLRVRGRAWLDERRRLKQRREVLAKHGRPEGPAPDVPAARAVVQPPAAPARARAAADATPESDPMPPATSRAPAPPVVNRARERAAPIAPPLPLAEIEPLGRAPAERRPGAFTLPPPALLDPAKAERKVDERELMDAARQLEEKCRDSSGPGRHHLRVQAGRRGEVQQGHQSGRRSVPGDAGRIGAHRPHPG
jgi:S-DNA-T family DNA segregation ATPase FtsK/SpoIIIE